MTNPPDTPAQAPAPLRRAHAPAPASAKENLLNLTPDAATARLREFVTAHGQPAYRAGQIARRLWQNPAPDFEAMTELPKSLRGT